MVAGRVVVAAAGGGLGQVDQGPGLQVRVIRGILRVEDPRRRATRDDGGGVSAALAAPPEPVPITAASQLTANQAALTPAQADAASLPRALASP
jgi:hypothetical protein